MKYKLLIFLNACILASAFNSCIKDEPLGRETDIVSFKIEEGYISSEISEDRVSVTVSNNVKLSNITPIIDISSGATITPKTGVVQDFSNGPVAYKVISEDGKYSKEYKVSLIKSSLIDLKFDFEKWEKLSDKNGGYHVLQTTTQDGQIVKMWDSGNPGIAFVNKGKEFPTAPTSDNVFAGDFSAKLETMKGNVNIGNIKIPIFSGSLFYGSFSLAGGISEPRKCLRLGQLYPEELGKPLVFTGYYKYTVGSPYIYLDENKNEVSTTDITDAFSLYSVLFRVAKGQSDNEYLDGITIMDSEKIVARADWEPETAEITDVPAEKGFKKFTIPFEYKEGVVLDYDKYDYKLTILFASSKDGNEYKGAIGSTLIIDNVKIINENDEDEE
ncbi:MAG: PCMD domain-containing protein [Dysgonomonas sp.]